MNPCRVEIQDLWGEYPPIRVGRGAYDDDAAYFYTADEAERVAAELYASAQLLRAHEALLADASDG